MRGEAFVVVPDAGLEQGGSKIAVPCLARDQKHERRFRRRHAVISRRHPARSQRIGARSHRLEGLTLFRESAGLNERQDVTVQEQPRMIPPDEVFPFGGVNAAGQQQEPEKTCHGTAEHITNRHLALATPGVHAVNGRVPVDGWE